MTCGSEGYATGSSAKSDYLKMNRNKTWTVSIPSGLRVTKFKVQGWQNQTTPTDSKTYTTKISAVNSAEVDYTLPYSDKSEASYTYNFPTAATGSFTFTISGDKQVLVKYTITAEAIPTGPTINTQPQSAAYVTGAAATDLTVSATTSGGTLYYKWFSCDDTNKTNPVAETDYTTTASYTPSTVASGTFYYFVNVKDDNGNVDSDVATITVSAASAPTISVSGAPVGDVVTGTEVTLTATMTGVPSPTIQWYSNTTASTSDGTEIVGETSETFSPSTATPGTYYFYAVASNSQGNDTSEPQTIVVKDKVATPTFTPNGTYFEGASQSVTIACATDGATIEYSTDNGDTWTDYTEAFNVTATTTVKAKATKDGCIDSDVASATFTKFDKSELVAISGEKTWTIPTSLTLQLKNDGTTTPAKYDEYYTYSDIATINGNDLGTFDGTTLAFSGEYPYRGSSGSQNGNLQFKTTVPGIVTVEFSNTGSSNKDRWVKVNETTGTVEANGTTKRTETFVVGDGTVTISHVDKDGNLSNGLRIYSITFTPVVKATIGTYKYATLSSQFDMDFTDGVEGLTAYKAVSATASTITLEEVTGKVKAGDGLVIKGTAGTYTIPTTTGASTIYDAPATINMFGCDGSWDEVGVAGSGTNFVLSVQDEKVVFAPVKNSEKKAKLKAGQAALWAYVSVEEARALSISFDDETTGIESVSREATANNGYYDLQGRPVAQPTKGLYIVNGKKVIIK